MTKEEAIERIKDHMQVHKLVEPRAIYITEALNMAIEALQEQRPKGHWIKIGNNQPMSCDDLYTCSECHKGKYIDPKGINFCENCGADMRDNPITIPYIDSQGLEFADTPTLASAT